MGSHIVEIQIAPLGPGWGPKNTYTSSTMISPDDAIQPHLQVSDIPEKT